MSQRIYALKWDEMSIKSYEEYSTYLDEIEGLIDLGPLGRNAERAKHVFGICILYRQSKCTSSMASTCSIFSNRKGYESKRNSCVIKGMSK